MRNGTPRALLFDVFGTLVDWRGSLTTDLTGFGRERELAADWPGLVDAWRAAYAPAMDRVRSGARPWANLDVLHAESLAELLPRFGLGVLGAGERAWLVDRWHRLRPWPEVPAALARLRIDRVCATLSNGSVALLIDLARGGGLGFDTIFSAEHFRAYKPDAETYLGATALLGLAPHEVTLVASHPADLAAARSHGLGTALVLRPLEYGPGRPPGPIDEGAVDLIVRDLAELAERLTG